MAEFHRIRGRLPPHAKTRRPDTAKQSASPRPMQGSIRNTRAEWVLAFTRPTR
jgi:hypothetical protein